MVGLTDQSKLNISNKIVGRHDEIGELQDIYRQLRDETGPFVREKRRPPRRESLMKSKRAKAVFVKGLSGTGKSRLVLEAFQSIVESDGGYFCQGKFDQNRSLRPFAALADALNDLCLRASKDIDGKMRKRIERVADKETARAIVSIIPNMKHCLSKAQTDPQSESAKQSTGSSTFGAGQQQQLSNTLSVQFKITFRKLANALMGERILVMFIDDLQWADIDSVDLIDELIAHIPFRRFLFIGGFRSDEVKEGHYLFDFLEEAMRSNIPASIVSVQQLTLEDTSIFVADTLELNDRERVAPLANLVHEKTQGNIFFVRQYLDFLYHNNHIFYSQPNYRWEWEDLAIIQDATAEESSIGAVVSKKILKLPRDTVDALKLAACLGGRFDLDVIEYVARQWWKSNSGTGPSSVDAIMMDDLLWSAVEEGLLEEVCSDPMSLTATLQYKFTHDKVQTASYMLIGEAATHYHLSVGKYLLQLYNDSLDRKWLLITAADHLHKAEHIVVSQKDRDEYAKANLLAAVELESNAAFKSAAVYCQNAIDLLGENCFNHNYDLSLKVYNMSATMEYCAGCKSASDEKIDKILEHAQCLDDKHTAYDVQIKSNHQINELKVGGDIAYALLRKMNVTRLPKRITLVHIAYEMFSAFRAVKRLSTEELLNKPTTEDQTIVQYTMFLLQGLLCFFSDEPNIMCYLTLRAVRVSLRFGYTVSTPGFYAICALLRLITTGNFQEADRIARMSMELSKRFNAPETETITKFMCAAGLHWARSPSADVPKLLNDVHTLGFSCGDSDKRAKFKRRFRAAYNDVLDWRNAGSPDAVAFCLLIEATKKSTFDKCSHDEVRVAYEEVIRKTLESGLQSFSTIAAERAGMHFASIQGQADVARTFLETAIKGYQDWRATAKVRDVYERHCHLLGHQPTTASNDTTTSTLASDQVSYG